MTAYSKQLIIFDLDDTLSPSKLPVQGDMAALLIELLKVKKVAILTGEIFSQIQVQLLHSLPYNSENLSNLILLPTSGTKLYVWKGDWCEQYSEHLTLAEKEKIINNLKLVLKQTGYQESNIFGDIIEDRGSQITFSALGQNAPLDLKKVWDPDREKRTKIATLLQKSIPEFDLRLGGTTSIDITKRGINKGYGIHRLEAFLNMPIENMVFVGEEFIVGGNNYPAKATGIDCIQVKDLEDTKTLIKSLIV